MMFRDEEMETMILKTQMKATKQLHSTFDLLARKKSESGEQKEPTYKIIACLVFDSQSPTVHF